MSVIFWQRPDMTSNLLSVFCNVPCLQVVASTVGIWVLATDPAYAPGVEALSLPKQSFYALYDPGSLVTFHDATRMLHEYVLMEGPFDAVMGFSGRAVLAALYMAELQQHEKKVPFKCGILQVLTAQLRRDILVWNPISR